MRVEKRKNVNVERVFTSLRLRFYVKRSGGSPRLCFGGDAGQFGIDHDAATVFAHNDFFVHANFHLALWRDAVEATAAGVALHIHDAKAVASVFADAFKGGKSTFVDFCFEFFGFGAEGFLFLTSFAHDFVEFALFFAEDVFKVGEAFLGGCDVVATSVNGS